MCLHPLLWLVLELPQLAEMLFNGLYAVCSSAAERAACEDIAPHQAHMCAASYGIVYWSVSVNRVHEGCSLHAVQVCLAPLACSSGLADLAQAMHV